MMAGVAPGANDPAGEEFFEKSIRPLLVERRHKCHSSSSKKLNWTGGLANAGAYLH